MATDEEKWEQELYPRLKRLYPDSTQRGRLKVQLCVIPSWQRRCYFEGDDDEVKAALDALLMEGACGQVLQGGSIKQAQRSGPGQCCKEHSEAGYKPRGA